MKTSPPELLYLDLMKKVLSFLLWEEPKVSIAEAGYQRAFLKQQLIRVLAYLARRRGWEIVERRQYDRRQREEGKLWSMQAQTMIGLHRLSNIQCCMERVLSAGIEGDFIETGVWRGGAAIFMRAVLAAYGITDRRVFVADSFRGLPPPDTERFPQDAGDKLYKERFLVVSREEVEENFRKYGLHDSQVVFLEGWFKDTLPRAPIEKLALMRLDGDMYGSTMEALTTLYPKLSPGGISERCGNE